MNIIQAIGPLANARQFIVYALVPKAGTWKSDKVPVNPATGGSPAYPIDAQDPANWLTAHEAVQFAAMCGPQHGVGIVIAERSGLFCVDLDDCLQPDGTWTPHAVAACGRFPGAYVEVSPSGRGLHIFGRYTGVLPPHSSKCGPLKTETYTRLRFIALTGHGAGDIQMDHTVALHHWLVEYFPPRPQQDASAEWTDKPVPEWDGPADDAELLRRAMRTRGAQAVFGGKASFADLFYGTDKLPVAFPSSTGDDFDRSSADLALANHLAFWTGNDCERMARIMRMSKLIRDKWDRDDYFQGTILNACASQREWYKGGGRSHDVPAVAQPEPQPSTPVTVGAPLPLPQQPTATSSPVPIPDGVLMPTRPAPPKPGESLPPGELAGEAEQQAMFQGHVYVEDIDRIMAPDSAVLDKARFDNRYPGVDFVLTADATKTTDSAYEAFTQSKCVLFPRVRGLFFAPTEPAGAVVYRDGQKFLNSWVPVEIACTPGDYTLFWEHLKKLLPKGRDAETLLYYMAAMVQYQGTKFTWCPFVQGVEGNGKSFLCEALENCIGPRYTHRGNAAKLDAMHNAELVGKIFLRFDEVKIDHAKGNVWETLKHMVTEKRLEIRAMQTDKVTRDICFNMMLLSNYKNGIRKTENDRRMAPFFCAQQTKADLLRDGLTADYFDRLWSWAESGGWAIINWFLRNITIPDEFNPATGCKRAPDTTSTWEAIQEGWGVAEQEVAEAIKSGFEGFKGGWVSSVAMDRLLAQIGKANHVPRSARANMLATLGYVAHPVGRVPKLPDGTMPTLYVTKDHPALASTSVLEVVAAYVAAQKG